MTKPSIQVATDKCKMLKSRPNSKKSFRIIRLKALIDVNLKLLFETYKLMQKKGIVKISFHSFVSSRLKGNTCSVKVNAADVELTATVPYK